MSAPLGLPRNEYTAEYKAEVVALALKSGVAEAARSKSVSKASVTSWLTAAGHDPGKVAFQSMNKHQVANAVSQASRRAQQEAVRDQLSRAYLDIAVRSATKQAQLLSNDTADNIALWATMPPGTKGTDLMNISVKALQGHMALESKSGENKSYRPTRERMVQMRDELADRREAKAAQSEENAVNE